MTAKRDLKKRIRARQSRTGERYATARAHIIADAPSGRIPVVEMTDVSATAASVGLRSRVLVFPSVAEHVDVRAMLQRIHDVVSGTEDDPSTALLRGFFLEGQAIPPSRPPSLQTLTDARAFFARARAGIGGISESGRSLAVSVEGKRRIETVVCLLWMIGGRPTCMILRPDDIGDDPLLPRSP
jgi:hypothetical protein